MKGIQANASQPDLVPNGGELPQTVSVPGQYSTPTGAEFHLKASMRKPRYDKYRINATPLRHIKGSGLWDKASTCVKT
ncbi:hypothetical protein BCON_0031g00220 [Botryotinia convoluta]|uniref:Uncharacterized protein n=1 Tax=Botryotinia convoluta TaxID=54673 RepID=A0A4Z1IHT1_9HELO|nr:hypothetical protein BCON_0031g00220 [Botryotinia convoluta]